MDFLVFIFGLAIGSFLNVLIFRLPEGKSILGFSKCSNCRKKIAWHDNIPVVSFFLLGGRCRNCGSKVSWQYPLVELLTGFLFLFSFLVYGQSPFFLIYVLFLISLFIVIAVIDLKHLLILDSLVLTGFLVSLLYFLFSTFYFLSALYGLLFFGGILLFLFLASKGRWLGLGDVKFAALLGFIFGLNHSINVFFYTFFIGFIIAIILLGLKKADLKTEIPLGSMMAAASILYLFLNFSFLDLIDRELILRLWLN